MSAFFEWLLELISEVFIDRWVCGGWKNLLFVCGCIAVLLAILVLFAVLVWGMAQC